MAGIAADVTAVAPEAVAMSDEASRAEWAGSSELQREFSTPGTYSAYQRAYENGQAKILDRPFAAPIASAEVTREGLMSEWARSPALQAEFSRAEHYAAYMQAERSGKVKLYRGRGVERFTAADFR